MENWIIKWIEAKNGDIKSTMNDLQESDVDFSILEQKIELLNELLNEIKKNEKTTNV